MLRRLFLRRSSMNAIGHFIGGKHVAGASGRGGPVFNPATGEQTATVALASAAEVDAAVRVATAAQLGWAATPPLMRARTMFKFKELLEKHRDDIARLITLEHGKTHEDAKGEVIRGMEVVEFACGIPYLLRGDMTPDVGRGIDTWSARHPLGVVAGITPFNFPVMVGMWMAPMALACGNAFLWKPSEKDPTSSMRVAELLLEAGVPAGVLNVINGDKVAVDALLAHPGIAAISFVGSTAVGEYIYTTGCAHAKRVQALCGAKNHMVVMPDADLDQTVDALMGAGYGAAGRATRTAITWAGACSTT
jgi:malonate-semialdehyde dehydrogenase (acetylating)/methylmalonate-semialdehyde dehydrogenase